MTAVTETDVPADVPEDLEIARAAELKPIEAVAGELGLGPKALRTYGDDVAKIDRRVLDERRRRRGQGRLVLVTGMSPTPAGEGKTTVSVGLADGLRCRDVQTAACLREPSLGPVFGIKGGAAGGGHAQVVPMDRINLHLTGDMHAISSAHALLSALVDNHLHRGGDPDLDPRRITWKRAVDMNDRALRNTVVGLGGETGGVPREDGFMITAASEVMAVLCLAADVADLRERLGRIVVGYDRDDRPVRAAELGAPGAMATLLRDALSPNLVQTLEGTPALIHGGPFANIAHGCSSLTATRGALGTADVVVTEAGFGSDLGAEKFFDIKCRAGGLAPEAAVVVATVRALKMHGGVPQDELGSEDPAAVRRGMENLRHHVENVRRFGVPPVVAINRFAGDTESELRAVERGCREMDVPAARAEGFLRGGEGSLELADAVRDVLADGEADFEPLYPDGTPVEESLDAVVREVYGGESTELTSEARADLERLERAGLGSLPVCVAKTQYSLSDDPDLPGRPSDFRVTVRRLTPSAGAGFVVAHAGDVMTMPGLPAAPAAAEMDVEEDGTVSGLF